MDRQERLAYDASIEGEFRAREGHVGQFDGRPVMLLHTVGTKSGEPRTSPLRYFFEERDPSRIFIIGTFLGSDRNPAWFNNITGHPEQVSVTIGTTTADGVPEVLREGERVRAFAMILAHDQAFEKYLERTDRSIPVVAIRLAGEVPLDPDADISWAASLKTQ